MNKDNEFDEGKSGTGDKSIKKLLKSQKIVKKSKNFKGLKILQMPLVWKIIY